MDVGRSTSSLGKVSILRSTCFLSVEGTSWSDGGMDLLDFKNTLEGLRGEEVDFNMPHGFGAFIHHLSPAIPRLLLVSNFLQHLAEHLGDPTSITSIVLELLNISIWKSNP
jgi:hypothetical protein